MDDIRALASEKNGFDWLDFAKKQEAVAFVSPDGSTVTYRQFAIDCDQYALYFPDKKTLSLIECDNSYPSILAIYATLRAGHAALLAAPEDKTQLNRLTETYKPDFIVSCGVPKACVGHPNTHILHKDLALLINTSGSTGSTKAVKLSLQSVSANARDIADYLSLASQDRALLTLPLHYCYGLSVVSSHLYVGASLVTGQANPIDDDLRDNLINLEVTNFPAVPFTIELLEKRQFRKWQLPVLRFITQAGGRLNKELVTVYANWAKSVNKSFFVMYGATEATARMAYMTTEQALKTPDCIGQSIPNGRFEIIDENGKTIESPNIPGELVYYGPNVMMGYAINRQELELEPGLEKLVTGDIAEWNEHGLVRIVGRKSRFSKLYGKRQNLADIEQFFNTETFSLAACSDDHHLFLAIQGENDEKQISMAIQTTFGINRGDIVVCRYETLPRLASGKVDYPAITKNAKQVLDSQSKKAKKNDNQTGDMQKLIAIFARAFNRDISINDSFNSLGGDSLTYVQISMGIEDVLGYLPDKWETLTVSALYQKRKKPAADWLSQIETNVFLRAVAIVFVVLDHSGQGYLAGGALLLLFIAGHNMARFRMLNNKAHLLPTLWSIVKGVLVPFWLLTLTYGLLKGNIDWNSIALISTIIGKNGVAGFQTWFVISLVHAIVLTSLLTSLFYRLVRKLELVSSKSLWLFLVGVAALLFAIDQSLMSYPQTATPGTSITRMYLVFTLGLASALLSTARERALLVAVMLVVFPIFSHDIGRQIIPLIGALLCIFLPKMYVPSVLNHLITWIGGGSLFIYMLHGRAPVNSWTSDWTVDILRVVIGISLGIAAWIIYNRLITLLNSNFIGWFEYKK